MNNKYITEYNEFKQKLSGFDIDVTYPHAIECYFESLKDWSQFYSIKDVKSWLKNKKKNTKFRVKEIPLNKTNDWFKDKNSGNINHVSDDFFTITGVRVTTENREKEIGWDQPIVKQKGLDGGILGLIRKRFNGIPHYLCEAKEEPGNYGKIQISPTLQATFANLNQKHKGRKPHFSEIFKKFNKEKEVKLLFNAWLAEDGGRLYLKRNKAILIELSEKYKIILPNDNFIWLSLYQIKTLLKENAIINPHLRGILSHV